MRGSRLGGVVRAAAARRSLARAPPPPSAHQAPPRLLGVDQVEGMGSGAVRGAAHVYTLAAPPPAGVPRVRALNHVAIAVPDLAAAAARYREALGAQVSDPVEVPEHGVTVVFVELDNTKIELLHPLGEGSPIQKFLEKFPGGGMHHMCFEVDDIQASAKHVAGHGRVLNPEPRIGAHGKPVVFLHPKDYDGTLVELEQS